MYTVSPRRRAKTRRSPPRSRTPRGGGRSPGPAPGAVRTGSRRTRDAGDRGRGLDAVRSRVVGPQQGERRRGCRRRPREPGVAAELRPLVGRGLRGDLRPASTGDGGRDGQAASGPEKVPSAAGGHGVLHTTTRVTLAVSCESLSVSLRAGQGSCARSPRRRNRRAPLGRARPRLRLHRRAAGAARRPDVTADVGCDVDALALGVSSSADSAALAAEIEALSPAARDELVARLGALLQRRIRVRFDGATAPFEVTLPERGRTAPPASPRARSASWSASPGASPMGPARSPSLPRARFPRSAWRSPARARTRGPWSW